MITLNLTKAEIERLYRIWQHSWPHIDPDEEDTLGRKIQDAFIHRDDDIEPEYEYECEETYISFVNHDIRKRESQGWTFVSMSMSPDNTVILLFRK